LPPNPPPTGIGTTLTRDIGSPTASATRVRQWNAAWVEV
jgi:hypothetical protein